MEKNENSKKEVENDYEKALERAKARRLVLPGEELGYGIAGSGTYIEKGIVVSKILGLADERNGTKFVIPLSGVYNPKRGDGVIGIIKDIVSSKWLVDINSPYLATLSLSDALNEFIDLTKEDLTKYYDINDVIFTKVLNVSRNKLVTLTMKEKRCRKLYGGTIIKVTPSKVPRIIGRKGSMVELIKEKTGCQIVVGQNGLIWIKGENKRLATEAILKIENYAHKVGLTDKIKEFLDAMLAKAEKRKEERLKEEEQGLDIDITIEMEEEKQI
ncbi:MAG: exosome complex RNA-binding protein Rrp4 [Candidatus Aenigmatarchaeota archaeon]|nr:exosome complex protein Rrp4 [Candidatus Aenigmarchaeota archaeon]